MNKSPIRQPFDIYVFLKISTQKKMTIIKKIENKVQI
jgi:hypothetical protein